MLAIPRTYGAKRSSPFTFSSEFRNFTQAIFGTPNVRAEVNAVTDFYRGLLARLPDDSGFNFWLAKFRAAQCTGQAAIITEVDGVQSLNDSGLGSGAVTTKHTALGSVSCSSNRIA